MLSPIARRRLKRFRANRLGWVSLWLFARRAGAQSAATTPFT